jgi:hypothetical protein
MSRRYSTSRQVFYSITGVTVSQAAVIRLRSSATSCTFVWYTKCLCTPIERNLKGLDWEKGYCRMASQVTRFEPFRFHSMGLPSLSKPTDALKMDLV